MGEEETSLVGSSQVTWVVDPLDGTVNFLYRRTDFAVSVAAEINGVPVAGAVFDVPRNLLYSAGLGLGASRNGHPLLLAQGGAPPTSRLSTALLATGFGYDSAQRRRQAAVLAEILPLVRDIRRAGSAACDLCAVASGQADLYYEMGLKHWDYAAGALIAAEAGASVVGRDSLAPSSDLIVAGPTGLVDEFLEVLEPELEKWWPRP
jgi:myo-inositol-1(or 4)-monophosphatase